jgi:hypothetical protein
MVQEIILIKIIAGTDKTIRVMLFLPGYTVGYLEQEPLMTVKRLSRLFVKVLLKRWRC